MRQSTVLVVVLGNIGQCPRMRNHIEQLLSHQYHVIILAYQGSIHSALSVVYLNATLRDILDDALIDGCSMEGQQFIPIPKFKSLEDFPSSLKFPFAILKILSLFFFLLYVGLIQLDRAPNFILCQVRLSHIYFCLNFAIRIRHRCQLLFYAIS
jgi:hypothetical protein